MKKETTYTINKGINRPIEFRGLKAQYIYILAVGLAVLLVGFTVMYIAGVPLYVCLPMVLAFGGGLFSGVYRLSHRFGEHGLMKALAHRRLPTAILGSSRAIFFDRLIDGKTKEGKDDHNHGPVGPAARSGTAAE
ncbi:DUF4133 domain-containing protein [Parapedobacter sp. ISTM3]|uniref:DUF4133 domain-containing protein n=1 Tax=Parapedobacter sp. ISTM3 TaxID=2800130 RepID=UPI001F2625D0|nr:DUF4133 domain-containing protein [Parapedobacter sp. ISTM3]